LAAREKPLGVNGLSVPVHRPDDFGAAQLTVFANRSHLRRCAGWGIFVIALPYSYGKIFEASAAAERCLDPAGLESSNRMVIASADLPLDHQATLEDRPLVLVFRTSLLPLSETFIRNQVLAMRRWRPMLIGLQYAAGLELSQLSCQLLSSWNMRPIPGVLRALLRELNLAPPGVRRYLRSLNPSAAHVHFGTDLVALWPMLNQLDVPILTTLHGYDINTHAEHWRRSWRASRKYPERLLEISRDSRVQFVAVSEAIKQRAIEFGLPEERIFVRYIGVDTQQFAPSGLPLVERPRRILFVGRMVEKKGPAILLRAFAEVRSQVPDAELVMIGDGPLLPECHSLAASLQVPVQFLAAVPNSRVQQEMSQTRVFCLPSITAANGDAEGLGIAIVEAQAAGVPVVTSARGGAGEAIEHGVTGFAFAESDVGALSAALIRLLRDDTLAAGMSRASRDRACRLFDLQKCTGQLESLYDQTARHR
jgi:glycosyltransferase involved in cell wall biosynthesis